MSSRPETASPWMPTRDIQQLKLLGKMSEECGELISAAQRCLIQGIDERDPETGELNREWLEDECADVLSKIGCVITYLKLNHHRIMIRADRKTTFHEPWFEGRV